MIFFTCQENFFLIQLAWNFFLSLFWHCIKANVMIKMETSNIDSNTFMINIIICFTHFFQRCSRKKEYYNLNFTSMAIWWAPGFICLIRSNVQWVYYSRIWWRFCSRGQFWTWNMRRILISYDKLIRWWLTFLDAFWGFYIIFLL